MASSAKLCLYEVLGVDRGCSADEIRSAYKRLALQRHPDKLVQSGVPEAEATAAFQELVNAYEVLSDPRERGWYDSNRNQILFSSNSGTSGSTSQVPDLFPFFSNSVFSGYSDSGRGFYKVYGDLFEKIYANEKNFAKKFGFPDPREAPVIGNSESPYVQVTAFYNYWSSFTTVLDFFWVDEVAVMPNRKSRRLLEDHNKKLRKAERKKYNDIVRQLSEFVKKRDNRVREMQLKKNEELMKKRELEKQKMKELERQKAEKARNYEEPDWSKVEEVEEDETEDELQEKRQEFYCVICSKRFKSDKQWKNHEQSRKHKDKARELTEGFDEEDNDYNTRDAEEGKEGEEDTIPHVSGDGIINELKEQFEQGVGIKEDRDGEEEEWCSANESGVSETSMDRGLDEDESSTFEAMVFAHRNKNNFGSHPDDLASELEVEKSDDEQELTYNNVHSRRNRRNRRRGNERHAKQVDSGQVDVTVRDKEVDEETTDNAEVSQRHQFSTEHAENNTADDLAKSYRKHEAKTVKNSSKKGSTSRLADGTKERNKGELIVQSTGVRNVKNNLNQGINYISIWQKLAMLH